jgi:hypothetical protein
MSSGEAPTWISGTEAERIYHYTTANGLKGIIESKRLWATDVWFMNDTAEATYGLYAIERFLNTRENTTQDSENAVRQEAADIIRSWREQDPYRNYIACLSENGDQLSQWRAYGSAIGFSIGFDRGALERLFYPPVPVPGKLTVRKVVYDTAEQDRLNAFLFQRATAVLSANFSDDEAQGAAFSFALDAIQLAPAFKHPAFVEEAEVRIHTYLVPDAGSADDPELKFRESAMGVTPFVEIPLSDPGTTQMSVIREVIVGPQRHPYQSQRAIEQLLVANGLPDIPVSLSKVPLRS